MYWLFQGWYETIKQNASKQNHESLREAVKLVQEQDYSIIRKAAAEKMWLLNLRHWVKELQREGCAWFRSLLTPTEEQDIVEALKISAQLGWPCGKEEVKVIVKHPQTIHREIQLLLKIILGKTAS